MNVYRAKAFECLSLAEYMNNPEERAEMVCFARVWMSFAEPIAEARGAYEWSRRSLKEEWTHKPNSPPPKAPSCRIDSPRSSIAIR